MLLQQSFGPAHENLVALAEFCLINLNRVDKNTFIVAGFIVLSN
jgi:hypothetical protein